MPLKIIEEFNIKYLQILDEKGVPDMDLEPDIDPAELLRLYRSMVFSRMVDSRMLKLQRQGRIGTFPATTGQEAAFCAPMLALRKTDWFVGSYRELGARLMRGEPFLNSLLLYNGYEEGNDFPESSRTPPISIVLASQLPIAVGLSYGSRLKGEDVVSLVIFGDGSTSEGDFHEALNFAAVLKAPVVFLCQNNQFAISTPRNLQTLSATIAQKAIAYGIPGLQADGNDSLAVYQATKDAVDRARRGEGPSLIEAFTYRMLMHTTADDPSRYRNDSEVVAWQKKDPIIRFKAYLENKKMWDAEKEESLREELKQSINSTVKEFEKERSFKPDAHFDYVFGDTSYRLDEQRKEFLENHRKER